MHSVPAPAPDLPRVPNSILHGEIVTAKQIRQSGPVASCLAPSIQAAVASGRYSRLYCASPDTGEVLMYVDDDRGSRLVAREGVVWFRHGPMVKK